MHNDTRYRLIAAIIHSFDQAMRCELITGAIIAICRDYQNSLENQILTNYDGTCNILHASEKFHMLV